MNVIVHGMQMPQSCSDCPLLHYETNFIMVCSITRKKQPYYDFSRKRGDDCPLIEMDEEDGDA